VSARRVEWAIGGGLAAWALARATAADRIRPLAPALVPLLSFTPQAGAAAGLAALALRGRGPAAAAALAAGALAGAVTPRLVPRRQPAACGPVLRVLTINLHYGTAAGAGLTRLTGEAGADVLFVQELGADGAARLAAAGLGALLPHEMHDERTYRYRGSAIYARYPLREGLAIGESFASQPTARLELPSGHAVQLVCVHPHPPFPPWIGGVVPRWRGELTALPPPGDPPVVLAGDYNATADHEQFRRLLRLGHVDAASQLGRGLVPTWGPQPGGSALLTVDHILVDPRCAVSAVSALRVPCSDHRALYAEFRLPG
jgi:endonuclease/exonuclease/phosphatase (EEP) superfamily protein YafD